MLDPDPTSRHDPRRGVPRRGHLAGSSALVVLAGLGVLCTGTAAAALAAVPAARAEGGLAAQCQEVAPRPSSAPASQPAPAPTVGFAPASVPSTPASERATGACVRVQAVDSTVVPGQMASFDIQVSPVGLLDQVAVLISVTTSRPPAFPSPTFTSCGAGDESQTCTVGVLQAGQAGDMAAQVVVPSSAPGGDTATLSATVTWTVLGVIGTGSVTGSATVDVVAPPATSPPTPPVSPSPTPPSRSGGHHHSPAPSRGGHAGEPSPRRGHPGSSSTGQDHGSRQTGSRTDSTLSPLTLRHLPPLLASNHRVSAVNPADLFPVIRPAPLSLAPAPRPDRSTASSTRTAYRATAAADILPLSMRQLDAQVAGLLALAVGVIITAVKVPWRRRFREVGPSSRLHARSTGEDG